VVINNKNFLLKSAYLFTDYNCQGLYNLIQFFLVLSEATRVDFTLKGRLLALDKAVTDKAVKVWQELTLNWLTSVTSKNDNSYLDEFS
jgi:hypothetical protein